MSSRNSFKLDLIVASFWTGLVVLCSGVLCLAFFVVRWLIRLVTG